MFYPHQMKKETAYKKESVFIALLIITLAESVVLLGLLAKVIFSSN